MKTTTSAWTKWVPWLTVLVLAGWLLSTFRPPPETGFHTRDFGKLPVLLNGRIQPFDSVARNSLLQIRTRQSLGDAHRRPVAGGADDEARHGGQTAGLPH